MIMALLVHKFQFYDSTIKRNGLDALNAVVNWISILR